MTAICFSPPFTEIQCDGTTGLLNVQGNLTSGAYGTIRELTCVNGHRFSDGTLTKAVKCGSYGRWNDTHIDCFGVWLCCLVTVGVFIHLHLNLGGQSYMFYMSISTSRSN